MARKEKVTKVIDEDTFCTNMRKNSVRLARVDTPEKGERGYQKATNALNFLIRGLEVTIDTLTRDSYGRSVANVKLGRTSVNKAMQKHQKK